MALGGMSRKLSKMEALGRVELPTNGLGNRCSIHLSYRAMCDVTPLSHVSLQRWALRVSPRLVSRRCPLGVSGQVCCSLASTSRYHRLDKIAHRGGGNAMSKL